MKLGARLRGFSDAAEIEGTTTDADRARHDKEVRQARLALARRQAAWTELPEARLVRRGRLLVDAETDLVWQRRPGHVWEPHRATVGYVPEGTPLTYYVDEHDDVVFLEAPGGPRTWSDHVARQEHRRLKANA